MSITVQCRCGTRVRGEETRLRRHPPCPECGAALPSRVVPEEKKIPFDCVCGLRMKFPESRGGLWFDCPECSRRTIIPGYGSSRKKPLPVDLPPESVAPRMRRVVVAAVVAAAMAAAAVAALFLM